MLFKKFIYAKFKIITIVFFAMTSPCLYAWDATGHELIAQIAYERLTPTAKEEVDRLTSVMDKHYPPTIRFMRAAVWADYIKGRGIKIFDDWHYIDIPYSTDGVSTVQPSQQNVVWAIDQSEKILSSSKPNRYFKAEFLRFLVHFVGDIQQPLHDISRFTRQHPDGDKGGNLFLIEYDGTMSLHQYWDRGVNLFEQYAGHYPLHYSEVTELAHRIVQDYPESYFGDAAVKQLKPDEWAKESYQIAKQFCYQIPEGSAPSNEYESKGQKIVEQRIALAGYRLANVLNTIFN